MKFGIDISRWQGAFNMKAAKDEGVEFVILKGGGGDDGLYVDSRFADNYKSAKDLGLPVGTYWYSRALNIEEAKAEADFFYEKVLMPRMFDLPVYIDVEHKDQLDLGKDKLTAIVKAWCERLEARGYWVGIYGSLYTFATYLHDDQLQRFAHWVAQWNNTCTYKGEENVLGMWQFGGETNLIRSKTIAGQTVDQNYMFVDYPSLIRAKGCNGYDAFHNNVELAPENTEQNTVPDPSATANSTSVLVEIIQEIFKRRLSKAGFDEATTKRIIDALH